MYQPHIYNLKHALSELQYSTKLLNVFNVAAMVTRGYDLSQNQLCDNPFQQSSNMMNKVQIRTPFRFCFYFEVKAFIFGRHKQAA